MSRARGRRVPRVDRSLRGELGACREAGETARRHCAMTSNIQAMRLALTDPQASGASALGPSADIFGKGRVHSGRAA